MTVKTLFLKTKKSHYLIISSLIVLLLSGCGSTSKLKAPISVMDNSVIDSVLTEISRTNKTITEKMDYYSGLFLGMDYSWESTGDGPYALLEDWPLVNFQNTNCMVYCEHVLALAISDSWDNFFNNLQQIRYKDGVIGMRSRNHYTMGDWLPENGWILDDVTRKTGGSYTKTATRTISHKNFFENKGITDLRHIKPDREITIDYIPFEDVEKIGNNLKTGDIMAIIFADKTDIFAAHMLMAIRKNDGLYIRESTTINMSTFDTPFRDWTASRGINERYIGLSVMRVKDELNRPGRIILPWEIPDLKKKYMNIK
ncbi:N-acetylmuramoyl-L-alanine amidase-like domain-containing protein [candidate division KSB1 bacterium]